MTKQSSIAEILRRIRPLARQHQIAHLRGLISCEKKRSFRRAELEAALKPIVNQQIRREVRDEKRGLAS
jgi:hypothetical protein